MTEDARRSSRPGDIWDFFAAAGESRVTRLVRVVVAAIRDTKGQYNRRAKAPERLAEALGRIFRVGGAIWCDISQSIS